MLIFEILLGLSLGATILSAIAKRANIPYPTLLALGGAVVAFLPGAPRLDLAPELILALFVAPILLDAAHDASLRDLRDNWRPVSSLVLVAVGLTTVAVAFVARLLLPDLPWAAAVALGALLAPPDAVAALAVMRHVNPPHRIRKVLEGESLLNDASALLIYKLAVGALAAGSFSVVAAAPTFALVAFGSVAVGWLSALAISPVLGRVDDAPTSVILQFVITFGLWLLAERLGLSAVVTIVVFGMTRAEARPAAGRPQGLLISDLGGSDLRAERPGVHPDRPSIGPDPQNADWRRGLAPVRHSARHLGRRDRRPSVLGDGQHSLTAMAKRPFGSGVANPRRLRWGPRKGC